jgi:hypothetical protein
MLVLVVIAAVPLVGFASSNLALQGTVRDDHAVMGHYGFMAAFGYTVIGAGLLASLRPDGWRLTAWVAGLLPALLGLASLVLPGVSSSLSLVWALAAMAWGVTFVAVAEVMRRGGRTDLEPAGPLPERRATTGIPRWVYVSGIIVIVLALLFAIQHLTGGGGPGLHTP